MNWFTVGNVVVMTLALSLAVVVLRWDSRSLLNRSVAGASFSLALWSLGTAQVQVASDTATFWWNLNLALTGYFGAMAFSVVFLVTLTRLPAWAAWCAAVPVVLGAMAQTIAAWNHGWIFSGYEVTAWGNRLVTDTASPWWTLSTWLGVYGGVTELAMFVWAWRSNRSRRYRSLMVQMGVVTVVNDAVYVLTQAFVVAQWHLPDPSVILALVPLLNSFVLTARFSHLKQERPEWNAPLFGSLREAVLIADSQQRVVQVGAAVSTLLATDTSSWKGQKLSEVLGNAILESWHLQEGTHQPVTGATIRVGPIELLVDLTPVWDRFQDLESVLVRLSPASPTTRRNQLPAGVSAREADVVQLLGEGLNTEEIAEALFISPATVKKHLNNLFRKTGVTNRVRLLRVLRDGA